eukprot:2134125-Rhodomonas_salina.2
MIRVVDESNSKLSVDWAVSGQSGPKRERLAETYGASHLGSGCLDKSPRVRAQCRSFFSLDKQGSRTKTYQCERETLKRQITLDPRTLDPRP